MFVVEFLDSKIEGSIEIGSIESFVWNVIPEGISSRFHRFKTNEKTKSSHSNTFLGVFIPAE